MLKTVIFILKEKNYEGMNQIAEELCKEGITVQFGRKHIQEINQEMIVVTDQTRICKLAAGNGNYVIAYLTKDNHGEDFSDALYAIEGWDGLETSYFSFVYDRYAGNSITILESKRCIVREIKVEDVESLYNIYQDPSITKYMEDLMEDKEAEKEYTRKYIKNIYGFYGFGMWIVEEKETGIIIGRAGLESRDADGGIELGFVIAKPFQRRGYAYEVCEAIMEYAKEVLELDAIFAYVKKENIASAKLCLKLGFTFQRIKQLSGEEFCEYRT